MAISDVRTAIATSLKNISGLEVFEYAPSVLNPPAAYVLMDAGAMEYQQTAGTGTWTLSLSVVLAVGLMDREETQKSLDTYCPPTGTSSIRSYILAATPGTAFDAIWCNHAKFSPMEYNGQIYLTVRWEVKVMFYT